jgi:hypothetical protein
MLRNSMSATIVTLLIAAFVQNAASAQTVNYQRYQSAGRLKVSVASALTRFPRWRVPESMVKPQVRLCAHCTSAHRTKPVSSHRIEIWRDIRSRGIDHRRLSDRQKPPIGHWITSSPVAEAKIKPLGADQRVAHP